MWGRWRYLGNCWVRPVIRLLAAMTSAWVTLSLVTIFSIQLKFSEKARYMLTYSRTPPQTKSVPKSCSSCWKRQIHLQKYEMKLEKSNGKIICRGLFKSRQPTKITLYITVILPAVELMHMHIYCLMVNLAGCFPDFSVCCKYILHQPLNMTFYRSIRIIWL